MARRGHHVDVVSHKITNFKEEDNFDDVTVHRIRPAIEHPPSIRQNMIYIINDIIKGLHIIRQNKIDIIHTNNFSPVIVGSILAKIYKVPIVITIHDIFTTDAMDSWKKWTAQNNVSHISSIIGPLFEKITIKMPVDVIQVIPNGISLDDYSYGLRRTIKITCYRKIGLL
jgi:glycosyltransferase involved in cell wall biosynthesis